MTQPYAGVSVLVLGASGFIGRWVARRLAEAGARLTCAARDVNTMKSIGATYGFTADCVAVDLTDASAVCELFATRRPTVVFNLAGYGIDRSEHIESLAWRINSELVEQVAELTERYASGPWEGVRLVHAGSALEYGAIGGHLAEDATPVPTTLYGSSKLAGTRAVTGRTTLTGTTLRLFTVYGPGEHAGRLLPTLLDAQRTGTFVPLSAGTQERDFTYVEDVAEGMLLAGMRPSPPGRVANLATGVLTSVRAFAETAANVLGIPTHDLQFGRVPQRPDEMAHDTVAVNRLQQSLGWIPQISIAEGVRRTAAFETASASGRPPGSK